MDRRKFIKKGVIASAGIATGFGILLGNPSCKGANERITLALVGCGSRGLGCIISCCKLNANVVIKTVCDVNRTKLGRAVSEVEKQLGYAPAKVENMEAIFADKDVDAVWIATPEHWHMPATVMACRAGKDVYVEKNPSINIWEGRKMVEAATKYKRIVQVGFQNRSAPYALSAREYIKSGKLGKIVTVKCYNMLGGGKWQEEPETPVPEWLDWDKWLGPAPMRGFSPSIVHENGRGDWLSYWAYSGGGLADDASHVMDLARFVIGDPDHPISVYGWGGNHIFGGTRETPEFQTLVYDFGKFTLSCDNACATNYMTKTPGDVRMDPTKFPNWRNNATRTEIYGTNGLMYLGRHGGGWQVLGPDNEIVAQEGGIHPDKEHFVNFIDSLRSRKRPNGDPEECHRSATLVHLGNTAYRVGNKQLLFDPASEKFTNSEEANILARGTYRKGYKIPETV
ncbi:MAG: Gfo/Idh/MocA family oxidoreductase [Dysgonamonadaceae bacterium]|jgi:predicted dehydrogenase|nr:Gfo/Idh/MocA family oxidoreductase [Dysgonamonadaceae bacterium]